MTLPLIQIALVEPGEVFVQVEAGTYASNENGALVGGSEDSHLLADLRLVSFWHPVAGASRDETKFVIVERLTENSHNVREILPVEPRPRIWLDVEDDFLSDLKPGRGKTLAQVFDAAGWGRHLIHSAIPSATASAIVRSGLHRMLSNAEYNTSTLRPNMAFSSSASRIAFRSAVR